MKKFRLMVSFIYVYILIYIPSKLELKFKYLFGQCCIYEGSCCHGVIYTTALLAAAFVRALPAIMLTSPIDIKQNSSLLYLKKVRQYEAN